MTGRQKKDAKSNGRVTVNVRRVVEFFDEKPPESDKHATGLVAIVGEDLGAGLFQDFLERTLKARVKVLQVPVTTGKKKGKRLDRWIQVTWSDGTLTLFQSEIKNSSAHAFKGITLPLTASSDEISVRMRREWRGIKKQFGGKLNGLNKVLVPMRRPPQTDLSAALAPLIIYWSVTHPRGHEVKSFFWYPLSKNDHPRGFQGKFRRLAVFSMSTYLRMLLARNIKEVKLWMPAASARMKWLTTLFTLSTGGRAGHAHAPK
ncbi:MAG TPA: hypothetical protein VJX70_07935 [Candidatus Acidoferrum sp.]|nr:hypothetical protein [Candidatus Acidoferrum sp.]